MSERILLVDDEKDFTDVLAQRLETRGIKAEVVPSGLDAVEKARKESYDAIIVDLMMPGIDGLETCKRLLADNPNLQIILLSGHGTLEAGVEAMKLGAMDFLEKPADIRKLMEQIGTAKTRKMLLVEKEAEERVQKILKSKGW
jgi:DNA-binding response OmpR family regulator